MGLWRVVVERSPPLPTSATATVASTPASKPELLSEVLESLVGHEEPGLAEGLGADLPAEGGGDDVVVGDRRPALHQGTLAVLPPDHEAALDDAGEDENALGLVAERLGGGTRGVETVERAPGIAVDLGRRGGQGGPAARERQGQSGRQGQEAPTRESRRRACWERRPVSMARAGHRDARLRHVLDLSFRRSARGPDDRAPAILSPLGVGRQKGRAAARQSALPFWLIR